MRKVGPLAKTLLLAAAVAAAVAAQSGSAVARASSKGSSLVRSTQASAAAIAPIVKTAAAFGESSPVSALPKTEPPSGVPGLPDIGEEDALIHPTGDGSYSGADPVLQTSSGSGIPPTSQNFEGNDIGESSSDGVFVGAPPDTNGDVGPNHYVQTVNTVFSVYSKTGTRLAGPIPLNALWKSAPNAAQFNCTTYSRGDPIVQYDPLADR